MPAGQNIEVFDQEHHPGDEAGDHQAVAYQLNYDPPYFLSCSFAPGLPSNRSSATRRREFDSFNQPARLSG